LGRAIILDYTVQIGGRQVPKDERVLADRAGFARMRAESVRGNQQSAFGHASFAEPIFAAWPLMS
jgi:hypothetical protein